ncbi:hypothetical protein WMY93_028992 [Mugilogobius chulae]|uniref:L1 transposable element RRM domain-containing protein n=1 Tax=Mugilogobius chulae TaxID=88201 RepID=A0AAW0MQ20_9GOBI
MSGGDKREGRQTRSTRNRPHEGGEMEENTVRTDANALTANAPTWQEGLPGLAKLIEELRQEIKHGFSSFKEEVKADIKNEFDVFKEEINKKFADNYKELQDQKVALEEAHTRISEVEDWNVEVKDVVLSLLKEQKILKDKLTDLEGRSRRKNVRIFGVPEGAEGTSVPHFVEEMLRRELELPAETRLLIQRAHRALAEKPGDGAAPRSIVVNFHQFDTKEMILKKAWQKRLKIDGKPLFFDHDYAHEVVQKRKAYGGIKRVLKENGVKFQTPMTKIKIHWADGTKAYGNPHDAAEEMRKRGLEITTKKTEQRENAMERRLQQACSWTRAQTSEIRSSAASQRARERLQEFRR